MTYIDISFIEQFFDQRIVLYQGSTDYSGSFSDCQTW